MRMRVPGPSAALLLLVFSLLFLSAGSAQAQNEYGLGEPSVYLGISGLVAGSGPGKRPGDNSGQVPVRGSDRSEPRTSPGVLA